MRLAPGFGGIHLEDIATPGVYRIEEELDRRLDVPVLHDDQHGTAVVVMAAVLAAARRMDKSLSELVFGQVGLGAAGSAIAALASGFGFASVRAYDPAPASVERLERIHDPDAKVIAGSNDDDFEAVLADSDVLVLTTGRAGLLAPDQIRRGQIVMALSNPVPEISIADARAAGAAVAADGAIVNNVLAYPGLFRGALDARAHSITPAMKRAAALALADNGDPDLLLPDPLDTTVHRAVADAVAAATAS
jgi:malate dehydrogenase (oxaloacetate-decarboxylating)